MGRLWFPQTNVGLPIRHDATHRLLVRGSRAPYHQPPHIPSAVCLRTTATSPGRAKRQAQLSVIP